MRSAIYYPNIDITSEYTLRAALLMWDELKVIVPWRDFKLEPKPKLLVEAWELIGGTMCPDDEQKRRAHENIRKMLEGNIVVDALYRGSLPPPERYEIYPEKLFPQTWALLTEKNVAGQQLANGDFPFQPAAGFAVMAKLTDACSGTTFARWTDTDLAYGLVADRDVETAAQTSVIPLTLSLIDTKKISTKKLIDFRRRESSEKRGNDYCKMRHKYADLVAEHVTATANVKSENELMELRRQFKDQMRSDLKDLEEGLGIKLGDALTSSAVVSSVVGVTSWIATANPAAALIVAAGSVIQKIFELVNVGRGFSASQREIMSAHPMAYIYALGRA
jgi:hypothetical protein